MGAKTLALLLTCKRCGEAKPSEAFYTRPNGRRDGACRECLSRQCAEWRKAHPAEAKRIQGRWYAGNGLADHRARRERDTVSFMLRAAKQRAKEKGVPFALTRADIIIPQFCPVLGLRLVVSRSGHFEPASPSLDRFIPAHGYVPGNVCVISMRANALKGNGTLEELEAIVRWLRVRRAET